MLGMVGLSFLRIMSVASVPIQDVKQTLAVYTYVDHNLVSIIENQSCTDLIE